MRNSLRLLGCASVLVLLTLISVTMWVGMRIGTAAATRALPLDEAPASPWLPFHDETQRRQPGYGAIGVVQAVEPPQVVIVGRAGERTIVIPPETMLLYGWEQPSDTSKRAEDILRDLPVGTRIVVIGRPLDEAKIEARIIRIVPADAKPGAKPPYDRRWRPTP